LESFIKISPMRALKFDERKFIKRELGDWERIKNEIKYRKYIKYIKLWGMKIFFWRKEDRGK
jgi:capsid portal protein